MVMKTVLAGSVLAGLLALGGCSGGQVGYIATGGDVRVGTGDYDNGSYVELACDYNTGSVRVSSRKFQQGVPISVNTKAASCDTKDKRLIIPIRSSGK